MGNCHMNTALAFTGCHKDTFGSREFKLAGSHAKIDAKTIPVGFFCFLSIRLLVRKIQISNF